MVEKNAAEISGSAEIGDGTRIWGLSKVCDRVVIGKNCVIGRSVYLGPEVIVGNNCKIQNNCLIYEPARIHDGVFIGPAVVLTNDLNPRAVTPDFRLKQARDWNKVGVTIKEGASIGARSVCVAPLEIGSWAMVGAGSVVLKDVPEFALVVGNPARQIGWVGRAGFKLIHIADSKFECPKTGEIYLEVGGILTPVC